MTKSKISNIDKTKNMSAWQNFLPSFDEAIQLRNQLYVDNEIILPELSEVFQAFELCDLNKLKVVIIGQDPYQQVGLAHGLAFSTKNGVIPASLKNIFIELQNDLGIIRTNANLSDWANQGILLLNACLTVLPSQSLAHQHVGWQQFVKTVLVTISQKTNGVVFVAWGSYAQSLVKDIDASRHLIIKSTHPSPLSAYRGFFGSKPFSKINEYLIKQNKKPINW